MLLLFNLLHLLVKEDREAGLGFSKEALRELVMVASERDFDLYLETLGLEALEKTLEVFDDVRGLGYRKNIFMMTTDQIISEEMKEEFFSLDDIHILNLEKNEESSYKSALSMEEFTDKMNITAATLLGEEDKLGALDVGYYADFAVFDKDPFEEKAQVVMTLIGGEVVYDLEEDKELNWYDEYLKKQIEYEGEE